MENIIQEFKRLHQLYGGYDYQTKELAQYLGVSTRTIQRWMKEKTAPSNEMLDKIKTYLSEKKAPNNAVEK